MKTPTKESEIIQPKPKIQLVKQTKNLQLHLLLINIERLRMKTIRADNTLMSSTSTYWQQKRTDPVKQRYLYFRISEMESDHRKMRNSKIQNTHCVYLNINHGTITVTYSIIHYCISKYKASTCHLIPCLAAPC